MMCFGPGTGNYLVSGECVVTAPFPSGLGRALYISWSSQSFLGTVTYLGCWYCALEVVQLPWSWPPFSPFTVEICATARQRKRLTFSASEWPWTRRAADWDGYKWLLPRCPHSEDALLRLLSRSETGGRPGLGKLCHARVVLSHRIIVHTPLGGVFWFSCEKNSAFLVSWTEVGFYFFFAFKKNSLGGKRTL